MGVSSLHIGLRFPLWFIQFAAVLWECVSALRESSSVTAWPLSVTTHEKKKLKQAEREERERERERIGREIQMEDGTIFLYGLPVASNYGLLYSINHRVTS